MGYRALIAMVLLTACSFDPNGIAVQADGDPTLPDAPSSGIDAPLTIDGQLPDGPPMCMDDTCNGCSLGDTCTACCVGDCSTSSCNNGCGCAFDCTSPSADCKPTCNGPFLTTCTVDCQGLTAHKCKPVCNLGSVCDIDCRGAIDCEPICTTATCNVDCTDAMDCNKVDCFAGSLCVVQCGGSLLDTKCVIRTCEDVLDNPGSRTTCCDSGGALAYRLCNVSLCPLNTSAANCP